MKLMMTEPTITIQKTDVAVMAGLAGIGLLTVIGSAWYFGEWIVKTAQHKWEEYKENSKKEKLYVPLN